MLKLLITILTAVQPGSSFANVGSPDVNAHHVDPQSATCTPSKIRYPAKGEGCVAEAAAWRKLGYITAYAFGYGPNGRVFCIMPAVKAGCPKR